MSNNYLIKINEELCKGCKLCIDACKRDVLLFSKNINSSGYVPCSVKNNKNCTGCKMCAVSCPDSVIEIYKTEECLC